MKSFHEIVLIMPVQVLNGLLVKLRNNTRLVIEKTMGKVVVRKEDIATKSPYANTSK